MNRIFISEAIPKVGEEAIIMQNLKIKIKNDLIIIFKFKL